MRYVYENCEREVWREGVDKNCVWKVWMIGVDEWYE